MTASTAVASKGSGISPKWLMLLPAFIALVCFVAAILITVAFSFRPNTGVAIIGKGWTLQNYVSFLADPFYRDYLERSIWTAAVTTCIVIVLGYPVALIMQVISPRLRTIVTLVIVSQLFTPYVIRSFAFVTILGRQGPINEGLQWIGLIDRPIKIMFTEWAVIAGLCVVALPFMILPIYAAISAIPDNVERAAASLGADRLRTFWLITFPLSLSGLAAGTFLVFLFCFSSYVIPAILGGIRYPMIGNLIFQSATDSQNLPFAAAVALVALGFAFLCSFIIQAGFERRWERG